MNITRVRRGARHPVATVRKLYRRLTLGPGLPVGRIARCRRLLRAELASQGRILVVGHPGAVRQAIPGASLDVVGSDPMDKQVSVVSEALGVGSLPRRWASVVVIDAPATPERLLAATSACLPDGLIVIVTSRRDRVTHVPGAHVLRHRRRRGVHLVVARPS